MTKKCKKIEEMRINSNNIWENDVLNRVSVAQDFTNIINGIDQPFVISINAPYGYGKTFFLERWAEELKQDDDKYVTFFNSWKTDFEKDPIVPILNSVLEQLPNNKISNIKEKAIGLLCSLKNYTNLIIEFAGGPDNTLDKCKEIINPENILENYQKRLQLIDDFRCEVGKVITEKKLIIIIDELERCRPTYAVEVLETIKHLFNIPNLIFILGIDREQLKHTIASLYGSEMDKEGYLRRFIDLELTLPKPDRLEFCHFLTRSLDIKNNNSNDADKYINGINKLKIYFNIFSAGYNLSLREMTQCFIDIQIILQMIPENNFNLVPLLSWLVILKHKRYDCFKNIKKITYDKACLECLCHFKSSDNSLKNFMKEILILLYVKDLEVYKKNISTKADEIACINQAHELNSFFQRYNIERSEILDYLLQKMSYLSNDNMIFEDIPY